MREETQHNEPAMILIASYIRRLRHHVILRVILLRTRPRVHWRYGQIIGFLIVRTYNPCYRRCKFSDVMGWHIFENKQAARNLLSKGCHFHKACRTIFD